MARKMLCRNCRLPKFEIIKDAAKHAAEGMTEEWMDKLGAERLEDSTNQ
jgi:hypothetical protein